MKDDYYIIESEKVKTETDDNVINLVIQTIEYDKQILIFNNSKRSSEATAKKIADSIPNNRVKNLKELNDIANKITKALSQPTKQCKKLAECVRKGIAFHHSGLVAKQRVLIEENFKQGLIRVISSTPTLAAGLNLPAYKVIIKDYKRYSQRGMADIPILEYHQMSGRAGRPGKETIGKAVLCIKTQKEADEIVPKYVFGQSEEILSKLAVEPTLKMYILSLISMNVINSSEEIEKFFKNTLYAHQYKDTESLNYNIFRIINVLKDYKFISQDDDYYVATQLGKKISQLYLNPDTAYYFFSNIDKFANIFESEKTTKYTIYSLINFIVNSIEMKPLFRVLKAEEEDYTSKLENIGDELVIKLDPFEMDYAVFLNSLKTTDIFIDWILEAPESYISDKYKVTPGELNYKLETMDWLLYCLEEIANLKKEIYLKNYLKKLRTRFKFGIKEELLPLINLKGIGRVRARKLHKAGFKKIFDIKKANLDSLIKVLGESVAINLKNQLIEEKIEEKPFITRKPREIKVREVSDEEIEMLLTNYKQYEEEKKEESNRNLIDYF